MDKLTTAYLFYFLFAGALFSAAQASHGSELSMDKEGKSFKCFQTHIREALKVNRHRRELYSKLTNGKSRTVSNELILMEKLILPFAKRYDRKARVYQQSNIPIFCRDLISMSEIEEFKPIASQIPNGFTPSKKREIRKFKRKVKKAYKENGWQSVIKFTKERIKSLNDQMSFHCLERHFLESIVRSAQLAQNYIETAQRSELKSPEKLLWKYTKLQMFGLTWASSIDTKASVFQKQRIPILCNDVPFIPEVDFDFRKATDTI